jgi:hypothetical protein
MILYLLSYLISHISCIIETPLRAVSAQRCTIKEMPSSKYLSLASSRLSSLREYVSQYPEGGQSPQNWKQWAGQLPQKIKRARTNTGTDEISLFPGWAVRRYDNTGSNAGNTRGVP